MKKLSLIACCSFVALFTGFSLAQENDLAGWAEKAVSPDKTIAQEAQDHLRALGPVGLQALEQHFAQQISIRKAAVLTQDWARIGAALDRVGGQYDNYASGLYWYTDLEQAKAAARASGRPILSLRLLGRLDEELSCANSRFFRTTLYPSTEINQLLKDRFVLHWESVRPVPKVTIDFGDGRKLVRTITGNSIHYILDADGNIADALPGLYSAKVFAFELRQSADAVKEAREQGWHDYSAHLEATRLRLEQAWKNDLAAIQVSLPAKATLTERELEQLTNDEAWRKIAVLPKNFMGFDAPVLSMIQAKMPAPFVPPQDAGKAGFPDANVASRMAATKSISETPMLREVRNLSYNIAQDTVRNNYMLRTKILDYLEIPGRRKLSLAQINNWVYDVIFLTPGDDPWLGLAPPDVFSAIDKNGESWINLSRE